MTSPRLKPPFRQHDSYTLRQLTGALRLQLERLNFESLPRRLANFSSDEAAYRPLLEARGLEYVDRDIGRDAPIQIIPASQWNRRTVVPHCCRHFKFENTTGTSTHI